MYNSALHGSGLEVTQFAFLQVLSLAGEVTQGRMAGMLAIDSTTLSRSLKPLEKAGWIASRAGADRRERLLRLTPSGRKLLEQAQPRWREVQEQLRKRLGDAAWNLLMLSADLATGASRAG
jgi:DNA-binding MarR family transcriptional regulator